MAGVGLASHAGVFSGARISSLIRAPLKTPAWEARVGLEREGFYSPMAPPVSLQPLDQGTS